MIATEAIGLCLTFFEPHGGSVTVWRAGWADVVVPVREPAGTATGGMGSLSCLEEQVPHARREGQATSQAASIIWKISSTAASGSAASRASE